MEINLVHVHVRTSVCARTHIVLVEAVKCLCNVLLNNQHLASTLDQLGCLSAVTQRLSLCHSCKLPYELVQFDLRFLFLITACGPSERYKEYVCNAN